jgi:GntR family transcriptional regulator
MRATAAQVFAQEGYVQRSDGLVRRPLYLQVQDVLAKRIATGTWKPGASLPNETDIARELGVSVGTVRKAFEKLEADQLVARRQGRGTFVVDQTTDENILRFINLRDRSGERVPTVAETLAQTVRPATAEEQDRLELGPSETVVATTRLRRHHGRPFLVEERCLAVSRFVGLEADAVGDYRVIVLAQERGLNLVKAVEQASIAETTPEQAELLAVEAGAILLKLDRVIFAGDNLPVERRIAFCNLKDEVYFAEMR